MAKAARKVSALVDAKYWGAEPDLSDEPTQIDLIKAYNWYNAQHSSDEAKAFVVTFLRANKASKEIIRKISRTNSDKLRTIGWNCRILSNGGKLPKDISDKMFLKIKELADAMTAPEPEPEEEVVTPVVSIQERINNKASELIADLECEIDCFCDDTKHKFDCGKWFRDKSVSPQISQKIVDFYKPLYAEIFDAIEGKDEQLKEAYSRWKKPRLKAYLEFVKSIIANAEKQIMVVKASRKPRKKKEKPAAVLVSKMKYKIEDETYKIKSIKPTDIIGTNQLWLFNTKTRTLSVYNAMGPAGLSVKGTTLTGFDEKTSISKRLRKPEVELPNVLSVGKVAMRKLMDNIKTKPSNANGRINNDIVLLRCIK